MLSLRGRGLCLLALRGAMEVDGKRTRTVALHQGLRIRLAASVAIEVDELRLPREVWAVAGIADQPIEIPAPEASIVVDPLPAVRAGLVPSAAAYVWRAGEDWMISVRGAPAVPLTEDWRGQTGALELRAVRIPRDRVATSSTVQSGRIYPPMIVTIRYDTTTFAVAGRQPVSVAGKQARILCELALLGQAVPWHLVAGEVWTREPDRTVLRWNWDKHFPALRKHLASAGVRPDVVRSRSGLVDLNLYDDDELAVLVD